MENMKKFILILFVVLSLFLILFVIYELVKIDRNINTISNTERNINIVGNVDKSTDMIGNVEGKICYPSSGVPSGYILAKNIKTNDVTEKYFGGANNPEQQKFSISLDEGSYVFAYRPILGDASGNYDGPYGFFTTCALTTDNVNCSTPESHQLTKVIVNKNEIMRDVIICDYYYENNKPEF